MTFDWIDLRFDVKQIEGYLKVFSARLGILAPDIRGGYADPVWDDAAV